MGSAHAPTAIGYCRDGRLLSSFAALKRKDTLNWTLDKVPVQRWWRHGVRSRFLRGLCTHSATASADPHFRALQGVQAPGSGRRAARARPKHLRVLVYRAAGHSRASEGCVLGRASLRSALLRMASSDPWVVSPMVATVHEVGEELLRPVPLPVKTAEDGPV